MLIIYKNLSFRKKRDRFFLGKSSGKMQFPLNAPEIYLTNFSGTNRAALCCTKTMGENYVQFYNPTMKWNIISDLSLKIACLRPS